jgi:hypothetical protein
MYLALDFSRNALIKEKNNEREKPTFFILDLDECFIKYFSLKILYNDVFVRYTPVKNYEKDQNNKYSNTI